MWIEEQISGREFNLHVWSDELGNGSSTPGSEVVCLRYRFNGEVIRSEETPPTFIQER